MINYDRYTDSTVHVANEIKRRLIEFYHEIYVTSLSFLKFPYGHIVGGLEKNLEVGSKCTPEEITKAYIDEWDGEEGLLCSIEPVKSNGEVGRIIVYTPDRFVSVQCKKVASLIHEDMKVEEYLDHLDIKS
ncbi:hypothetical protein CMI42_02690 [Candidatus Pacearchaeota archaeon]|nr:hypothetical protein [Candidatus Pacearchaeota archaeon]